MPVPNLRTAPKRHLRKSIVWKNLDSKGLKLNQISNDYLFVIR